MRGDSVSRSSHSQRHFECRLLLLVTVKHGGSTLEAMSAESAIASVGGRYARSHCSSLLF